MESVQPQIDGLAVAVLFGIIQGALIIYTFISKKGFQNHRFVVFLIGILLFLQVYAFLLRSGLLFKAIFLMNTNIPFIFLLGPVLLFYIQSQVGERISFKRIFLHFIPFLFFLGYSFNFFVQEKEWKFNLLNDMLDWQLPVQEFQSAFSSDPWEIQGLVVVELLSLHLLIYSIFSWIKVRRSKSTGTSKTLPNQRKWLNYLSLLLFTGSLVIFFSEGGVINGKVFFKSPFPNYSADIFSTASMYITSLYLLRRPDFLNTKVKKYQNSSLTKEYKREKLVFIKEAFEKDRIYLHPDFAMDVIARATRLSKHHISQIINEELECTFFDLTNKYRVEEAKRILSSGEYVKIEQLAYQLGYKSKSSFFNAFKKATGLTPSKYIEMETT